MQSYSKSSPLALMEIMCAVGREWRPPAKRAKAPPLAPSTWPEAATIFFRRSASGSLARGFMPNSVALDTNHWFGPEDIAALTTAFEAALGKLGLVDRSDPTTVTLAKLIIELAKAGEREPERLCDSALKRLSK